MSSQARETQSRISSAPTMLLERRKTKTDETLFYLPLASAKLSLSAAHLELQGCVVM